jgi:hypothetical protein
MMEEEHSTATIFDFTAMRAFLLGEESISAKVGANHNTGG